MLADTYEEGRWRLLKRSLPPVAPRLVDEVWMERFVSCFDAPARRFERRQVDATHIATCTAEEMALHLVIEEAAGTAGDGSLDTDLSLPADPDRDEDFGAVRELLSRDHDVLLLFDGSFDGIEAPDSAPGEHRLFANLHPRLVPGTHSHGAMDLGTHGELLRRLIVQLRVSGAVTETQNNRLARLTNWLIGLTVALLILGCVQVFVTLRYR